MVGSVCGIWVYLGHQGAVAGCEDKDQNGRRRPNLLLSTTILLRPQATVKVSQHLPISHRYIELACFLKFLVFIGPKYLPDPSLIITSPCQ